MYLHPAMTLNGLAAGVTATFVTALVSMDCMNEFHHVVGIVQGGVPPYGVKYTLVVNGKNAPANWNRKSILFSEPQLTARGSNSPVFHIPRNFSNSDLITVNIMWVVISFVIKVFSGDRLALVARYANLYHGDRVRCGRRT